MDYSDETEIAGLESVINTWVIEIQILQAKIDEMTNKINNIKAKYNVVEQ